MTPRLVLASASPARRRVLATAGIPVETVASGVDEAGVSATSIDVLVERLATVKARAVAAALARDDPEGGRVLVLGCDSLLDLDGIAYGKPGSPAAARRSWARMSGRHGVLHTGHCLIDLDGAETHGESVAGSATTVYFGRPDSEEVAAYVASAEPLEVAGAFTLEGLSGWFIDRIDGDHGTVLGVSLPLVRHLLRERGVRVSDLWST